MPQQRTHYISTHTFTEYGFYTAALGFSPPPPPPHYVMHRELKFAPMKN
jgi:hypothetical protein